MTTPAPDNPDLFNAAGAVPQFRFSTHELDNGKSVQTMAFDCTLPFESRLGLYLNETALLSPVADCIQEVAFRRAAIRVGEIVGDNNVTKKWIQLSRPDGKSFGVSGVSRLLHSGEFEQWDALTIVHLQPGQSEEAVEVDLWGNVTDTEGSKRSDLLPEDGGRYFAGHYESMYKAMGDMLAKGAGLMPDPLLSAR